jgi:hypothetical protein
MGDSYSIVYQYIQIPGSLQIHHSKFLLQSAKNKNLFSGYKKESYRLYMSTCIAHLDVNISINR